MGRQLRILGWATGGVLALLAGVPFITRLEFGRTVQRLEEAGGQVHVSTAGNIVGLSFEGARVTDDALTRLRGLDRLSRLSLAGTAVTVAGLDELRGLTRLADLDLSHTARAAGGITPLKSLPALDTLRLHECAWVSDDDLAALASLRRLTVIDLSGTRVTDAGLRRFTPGPNLHFVNLAECGGVTEEGLERLLQWPQLQGVQLQGTQVTIAALQRARRLRPDVRFDFEACLWDGLAPFRDAGARFKRDEDGRIVGVRFSRAVPGLPYALLAELADVCEVNLGGEAIDDEVLAYVSRLPRLRTLDLTDTSVTAAGLRELARLPSLESLALCRMPVTRHEVESLAGLLKLRSLRLARGVVGPGAFASLGELSQVRALHLEGSRAPPAAVARLQSRRPDLEVSGVESLRLPARRLMPRHPAGDWPLLGGARRS